jgi:hypothetical protein
MRRRGTLIQILLPAPRAGGIPRKAHESTRAELTHEFGGLTRYLRAPAEGLWKNRGRTERDRIVVYEVMAPGVDRTFWRAYRRRLEKRFHQKDVVIRAQSIESL